LPSSPFLLTRSKPFFPLPSGPLSSSLPSCLSVPRPQAAARPPLRLSCSYITEAGTLLPPIINRFLFFHLSFWISTSADCTSPCLQIAFTKRLFLLPSLFAVFWFPKRVWLCAPLPFDYGLSLSPFPEGDIPPLACRSCIVFALDLSTFHLPTLSPFALLSSLLSFPLFYPVRSFSSPSSIPPTLKKPFPSPPRILLFSLRGLFPFLGPYPSPTCSLRTSYHP